MSRGIVWIAGYPRSGNTWVQLFLRAYKHGLSCVDINDDSVTVQDSAAYYTQMVSPKSVKDMEVWEQWYLRQAAMYALINSTHEDHPIVRTHSNRCLFEGSQLIPNQLTSAAIYLVRDPRAVAVSWSRFLGQEIDETIRAMGNDDFAIGSSARCADLLRSWGSHVESWRSAPFPVTVVAYEDLLSGDGFSNIVKGVGWKLDEDRLNGAIEATRFKALKDQEATHGFRERPDNVTSFFNTGGAGNWRDVLTRQQVQKIEANHGRVMSSLRYLLQGTARAPSKLGVMSA